MVIHDYDPPSGEVQVIYQDEHLLVVEKPPGLLTVPGRTTELADCLLVRLQNSNSNTLLVHRLDMETSGAMIFARTRHAQRHLSLQFERRHIVKTYVAVVDGSVSGECGQIDLPLRVDWEHRPRQIVDREGGRKAVTFWKVLKRDELSTRMELNPRTGRSHQLRVHMASIGHPVLGDALYAHADAKASADRLMLHSENLQIRHPDGGRVMVFVSPCPF